MDSRKLVGVAVLCWAFAAPPASAAIIMIDDFEAPIVTGVNGWEYRATGDPGWAWTTSTGVVHFNGSYHPGNLQSIGAGAQSIQLEITGNYIQRSIPTVAGQAYMLSFLLASYQPPGTSSLGVGIDGNPLTLFAGTTNWTTQTLGFVASGASTVIRFENRDLLPNPPWSYPHLDNVAIEAIPEPASLILVGLGLVGLRLRRGIARSN